MSFLFLPFCLSVFFSLNMKKDFLTGSEKGHTGPVFPYSFQHTLINFPSLIALQTPVSSFGCQLFGCGIGGIEGAGSVVLLQN